MCSHNCNCAASWTTRRGISSFISVWHSTRLHRVLERPQTIYLGIDPTAPSLHVGHLLPLLTLHRFQSMGHTCILLLGGATAAIGDPSGKSTERVLMDPATIHANCTTLHNQVSKWFDMDRLKVLNNAEWLGSMNILDFFVNTGKNMRVSQMLARDSVKQRLASEQGISFTEFAYQALQAYDFCHLYRHHGCTLQIGGSDQWGNITAGIDLIKKQHPLVEDTAFGLTVPLLTTSTGQKFGKTSGGTNVWLDAAQTFPFDVYQFFMQTADEDVERYLKLFTDLDDTADVMHEHRQAPEQRKAQTHLARHVTSFVHGDQATRQAEKASALLYGGGMEGATAQEILFAFDKNPRLIHLPRLSVLDQGLDRVALLSGACSSRAEANKLARSGGLYINGRAVQHAHEYTVSASDVVDNSIVILRVGKKRYHLIQLE